MRGKRPRTRYAVIAISLLVPVCTALGAFAIQSSSRQLQVEGLSSRDVLGRADVSNPRLAITAKEGADLAEIEVRLDGKPVHTHRADGRLVLDTPSLTEGKHELTATSHSGLPFLHDVSRTFTVDTTAPKLRLSPAPATKPGAPVTVSGRVEDAGQVKVSIAGAPVPVGDDGTFSRRLEKPPARIEVVATDAAGNITREHVNAIAPYPLTRAAHLTAIGWSSDVVRDPVLRLVKDKKINAVELDIKDENGEVGYNSSVPLAREIGAVKNRYDARKVIDTLHGMGARVVGRIVAFRDPILAQASHRQGKDNRLVQAPDGSPYDGGHYGTLSFTNFADPEVREYNIALATEAAKLGFDDILYDYVRRPDGKLSTLRFPGLGKQTPEKSIADFVADTHRRLQPEGKYLGVSVFGIAATRPTEIAQDIPALAQHADYIAPMVYPSHWAEGEYGVASPNASPYEIVNRSLADFAKQVKGTRATVVPWLQDFSLGVHYGPTEVADQIRAAAGDGMNSFLLWNAGASYQGAALTTLR
ncbi:putative glycoside hydrolase [Streptomyces sp. NBC_01431]|uniref:putative glycoside hydrolase n=1 Tax=Streptomyces sp. NBC_01431 TaxID=2903863 RepID=UPI002E37265E|nr:putative glycoside hydrolase [Streptomyces sp. NBC_01431]